MELVLLLQQTLAWGATYQDLQKQSHCLAFISHVVLYKIIVNLLPCLIFIVVGRNRQEIINLLPCLIFIAISRNGQESYFYQQH